jgi:hypothetical protein
MCPSILEDANSRVIKFGSVEVYPTSYWSLTFYRLCTGTAKAQNSQ